MRADRRNPRFADDRHNVADQPGGAIFWTGLILAIVLGLVIRGLINPSKVRARLETAASQIHPSLRVDFESAEISLASAWWPRFAVVVHRVRMVSTNTCWMSPRLLADEIRLPLSLTSALIGASPFGRIEAGEVELRLTASRPAACDQGQAIIAGPSQAPVIRPAIRIVRDQGASPASSRSSGQIDSLWISRLNLVSEIYPQGSVELQQVDFSVRAADPLLFLLRANLSVPRGNGAPDAALRAAFEAEYKEFPERVVDFRLNGHLREGSYGLKGTYVPDRDDLRLALDLRHMPLVELFELLKSRSPGLESFKPRLSWLSFRAETAGEAKKLQTLPVEISQFQLEGDLGEVAADRLRIESLNPLRFTSSIFQVQALDLDRLFQFLGRPHPTPVLNKVGRFEGDVEFTDAMNFRMRGRHSGLEFVFSNQGRREIQSVQSIRGEILRQKGRWSARVEEADIRPGRFDGRVDVAAAPDFEDLRIDLDVREVQPSPSVQALMTEGGEIAPLKGHLRLSFREGRLSGWRGQISSELVTGRGLRAENLQLQFSERSERLDLRTRFSRLLLPPDLVREKHLHAVFPAEWLSGGEGVALSSVSGNFHLSPSRDLRWTDVSAQAMGGASLSSQGQWNAAGQLSGSLRLRSGGKTKRFEIDGNRDLPSFRESGR